MAVKLPWFRMYTDFLNDPKMVSMAFEDQRHFIGVLALKADGAIDDDCNDELRDRIVAQRLWIDRGVIKDVKKRLVSACLINESWQPLAWEKRQRASDKDATGAERQRRYRESKDSNTLRNGDVICDSNTLRNADSMRHVTRLDTDTDTDNTPKPPAAGKPADVLPGFAAFWATWPSSDRKQAKGKCLEVWKKAHAERDAALVLSHVEHLASSQAWTKESGQFVPAPLSYLRNKSWEGFVDGSEVKSAVNPAFAGGF